MGRLVGECGVPRSQVVLLASKGGGFSFVLRPRPGFLPPHLDRGGEHRHAPPRDHHSFLCFCSVQNKLLSKDLCPVHPPASPSCLSSPDPVSTASPSTVDSVSPSRKAKKSPSGFHFHPSHLRTVRPQLTVGKVSSGIGAAAEVLINLYMNDHRPKTQATSPDLESMRKAFPLNLGGSDTCYFCKKRVYVMERLSAEGHFFHRECFRCSVCASTLRLAAYAFDSDEGKFFCKPHFIHCKTSTQQRKRRAELKQQRQEEGTWKEREAPRRDTPVESSCAAAAIGTPEGSPPVRFSLPVLHPLLG